MKPAALLLLAGAALGAARHRPTVFLIRHGEKPADHSDHSLSPRGKLRAQCLRSVFGADSGYNIGHIMVQRPKKSGARKRPYDTVAPLADDLDLVVDTSCKKRDTDCVTDVIENYGGEGNILLCWEHKQLKHIARALGGRDVHKYPRDAFDLIWVDPYPYGRITEVLHENCPGLTVEL